MVRRGLVGHELTLVELWVVRLVRVDAVLHLVAELPDQALDGPGSGVSQRTDCVSFDLEGQLLEHVDLCKVSVAQFDALQHVHHPASALTTRRALPATLVLVELGESQNCVNHVRLLVHHDHGSSAQTRSALFKVVKVHDCLRTLLSIQHGHRRPAWDDRLEIVPATNHAPCVSLDQLLQWDAHLFFHRDRVVNVATDAEQLCARVFRSAKAFEPAAASTHDRWANSHGLHVGHSRRATVEAGVGRERRLQARSPGFAFEALDEPSFFSANVSAGTAMDDHVKVVATAARVLANEALRVGLVNRALQLNLLVPELSSHVDVSGFRAH